MPELTKCNSKSTHWNVVADFPNLSKVQIDVLSEDKKTSHVAGHLTGHDTLCLVIMVGMLRQLQKAEVGFGLVLFSNHPFFITFPCAIIIIYCVSTADIKILRSVQISIATLYGIVLTSF